MPNGSGSADVSDGTDGDCRATAGRLQGGEDPPYAEPVSELDLYVDAWDRTASSLVALVEGLSADAWALPTDCPRWSVHDVFAHCAAIESDLAGDGPVDRVEGASAAGLPQAYTERGVEARRGVPTAGLIGEFTAALARRRAHLEPVPADPNARPDRTPGGVPWDWQTLLRNRVIDLWTHEQDIRRAVDLPGDLDSAGARVTQATFLAALPYVLAKRVSATVGTTVVIQVDGPVRGSTAARVDDDGRGAPVDPAGSEPDARIRTDTQTITMLGAGRAELDDPRLAYDIEGDGDVARAVLAHYTLTR